MARRYSARKWMATAAALTLAAGLGGVGTGIVLLRPAPAQAQEEMVVQPVLGTGPLGVVRGQSVRFSLMPLLTRTREPLPGIASHAGEETRGPALALMNFATGELLARKAIGEDRRAFVELSVAAADGSVRVNGVATGLIVGRGERLEVVGLLLAEQVPLVPLTGSLQVFDSRGQTLTALPAVPSVPTLETRL